MNGSFSTSHEDEITFITSYLKVRAHISAPLHLTIKKSNYNVIFGRGLLWELGTKLDFQNYYFVGWQAINLPLKSIDCNVRPHFTI